MNHQTPERNSIFTSVNKKAHTFTLLRNAMIVVSIVYLVLLFIFENIHTTISGLAQYDNIFNLFPLILFPTLAIVFHHYRKK
jgi:hypothetical protein